MDNANIVLNDYQLGKLVVPYESYLEQARHSIVPINYTNTT